MVWRTNSAGALTFAAILTGCCSFAATAQDIATEVWQQKYNSNVNKFTGVFYSAGFNIDGSVLASGFRGEADSGSAVGVRYNAETGAVLDTPPEWFLFESTWIDYAQDRFFDQHVDSSGNTYFVGRSYTSKFNEFRPRYDAPNIWKFGSSYAHLDRPLWRKYYAPMSLPVLSGVYVFGEYQDMALDSSDNIYTVGWYDDAPGTDGRPIDTDWIIDKYDSDGNRAANYPLIIDGNGLHDYAYAVAADSLGNFIVAGSTMVDAPTDHYDWVVRKYQGDGTLLWETSYDHNGGHDVALSVVVDAADNIIVGGYRRNLPADENDWYFVKYSKEGDGGGGATVLWEQSWDDGNAKHGNVYGMAIDAMNNFYVIGVQHKSSLAPVYTDRYRPVLQYRSGSNGSLLKTQDVVLDVTDNNVPASEHDYLRKIEINDMQLLLGGYTRQDDPT